MGCGGGGGQSHHMSTWQDEPRYEYSGQRMAGKVRGRLTHGLFSNCAIPNPYLLEYDTRADLLHATHREETGLLKVALLEYWFQKMEPSLHLLPDMPILQMGKTEARQTADLPTGTANAWG